MAAGDASISYVGIMNISGATVTQLTTNLVASGGFLSGARLYLVPVGAQLNQVAVFKATVA